MRRGPIRAWSCFLVLLAGCDRAEQDLHQKPSAGPAQPEDSLATVSPAGQEVWFTLARTGRGPSGRTCVERGLEIRAGGTRTPIPLLYTREAPVLVNDSTIRAVLWTNCRPGDAYRVNLRNGRPVREGTAGKQ